MAAMATDGVGSGEREGGGGRRSRYRGGMEDRGWQPMRATMSGGWKGRVG